jgi:hypothetical protein
LDRTKDQIRLLSFSSFENMEFAVSIFAISECPAYDALSYVWGIEDKSTERTIRLNGQDFSVRHNLFTALTALAWTPDPHRGNESSEDSSAKYLWIDALCIDQENVLERNHQVQLMKSIFSQARCVKVWLGNECEGALDVPDYGRWDRHIPRPALRGQQSRWFEEIDGMGDSGTLRPFINAEYWRRVWTVQEFEVANEIIFIAGNSTMKLPAMLRKLEGLRVKRVDTSYYHRSRSPSLHHNENSIPFDASLSKEAVPLMGRLRDRGQPGRTELWWLISKFSDKKCSDPRDTVYGLLGLSVDERWEPPRQLMQADYTLTAKQLCEQLRDLKIEFWRLSPLLKDAARAEGYDPHVR